MKYVVSRDLIQQFVMMNMDAMDLFPDDAPSGTSFYELIPENGEPVVITYDDAINAVQAAIKEGILAGGGAGLLHSVKDVLKNHKPLKNPVLEALVSSFLIRLLFVLSNAAAALS